MNNMDHNQNTITNILRIDNNTNFRNIGIVCPKIFWMQILHDYSIIIHITELKRYPFNNMKNFQDICYIHSFSKSNS